MVEKVCEMQIPCGCRSSDLTVVGLNTLGDRLIVQCRCGHIFFFKLSGMDLKV